MVRLIQTNECLETLELIAFSLRAGFYDGPSDVSKVVLTALQSLSIVGAPVQIPDLLLKYFSMPALRHGTLMSFAPTDLWNCLLKLCFPKIIRTSAPISSSK